MISARNRVSPLILDTTSRAECGAHLRVPLLPSAFRESVHPYRQPPSGQLRAEGVYQLFIQPFFDIHAHFIPIVGVGKRGAC